MLVGSKRSDWTPRQTEGMTMAVKVSPASKRLFVVGAISVVKLPQPRGCVLGAEG